MLKLTFVMKLRGLERISIWLGQAKIRDQPALAHLLLYALPYDRLAAQGLAPSSPTGIKGTPGR
ncbi:hypothetical protein PHAMO_570022 [Magnetospirillum molischianum DSM 120]|uniref:Uncharacterized protein n=1 Tax=Magnetospirillum molischianum DSM 120 TaxID=1150626 RepID=H8FXD9_MAGML|nr:hypothetical protein PHAMO_570022 [Magnetospirillum molischianum DSM 120]